MIGVTRSPGGRIHLLHGESERREEEHDTLFCRIVAHTGAVKEGQFNFTGGQLSRKVGP